MDGQEAGAARAVSRLSCARRMLPAMCRIRLAVLFLLAVALPAVADPATPLTVMTFNIRYGTAEAEGGHPPPRTFF